MRYLLIILSLVSLSFPIDGLMNHKQQDIFELVKIMHEPVDTILHSVVELMCMFGCDDINTDLLIYDLKEIIDQEEYYMIFIPYLDEKFTHFEIQDLLRFYNSHTGKKFNSLSYDMTLNGTQKTIGYIQDFQIKAKKMLDTNKDKYIKK